MSAYGKAQPPQVHGFESTRTFPESSYGYSAPIYSQPPTQSNASVQSFQDASSITQMAYPSHQPRQVYDEQAGPYLNVGSTPTPEIKSFNPARGTKGTKFYVSFNTLYELQTSSTPAYFLIFGQTKVPASLNKINHQGSVCQYSLSTDVPQLSGAGWPSSQVPVSMLMEAGDGDVIAKVDVGGFTYIDLSAQVGSGSDVSRKRKISIDSAELMKSPPKRSSSQHIKPKEEFPQTFGYPSTDGPGNFSPFLQSTQPLPSAQSLQTAQGYSSMPYTRPMGSYASSSRPASFAYTDSSTNSPSTSKSQPGQGANWNSTYGATNSNINRNSISLNGSMARPALSALPSPAVSANPPLIRTSTLQQSPSPASTPHGGPGNPYSAYPLYPHKAKLEINGDLDALAHGWSDEEWEAKRRIIHFRRSQSGSTISTTFTPVSPDDRPQNSVCISCIYWEERDECFVTSVDTIYLLEHLVAARFTVEEKNRIRRNLEGFRPATVSKAKPDSEEFFKVIMAFPAPKPRHIEKDVKVFSWKVLAQALKKIISKYSASPSSTLPPAPALLTPVSSSGYATDSSAAGLSYAGDHHGVASPRSISASTASTAYNTLPARALSPQNPKSMTLQNGNSDLRVSVAHNPHETSGHWAGGPHHMQGSQQYQQLGNQTSRGSWDIPPYLDGAATNAGSNAVSSHNLNYHHARNSTDTGPPGDRRYSLQQQSHQIPRS